MRKHNSKKVYYRNEDILYKWLMNWFLYIIAKLIPIVVGIYFIFNTYHMIKTEEIKEIYPFYLIFEDAENYPGEEYPDAGIILDEPYEEENGTHHVDPHYVEGYERSDGTYVEGYWRGGEEGYERSNPDGDPSNNLYSDDYEINDSGDDGTWYDSEGDGYEGLGAEIGEYIFGN